MALLNAPAGIREALGPLPKGARLQKDIGGASVILCFVKSVGTLGRALAQLAPGIQKGRTLWVCWPKRTSAQPCDLTANLIRDLASPYNLVDSKLCAIDETWSATALSKRRQRRVAPAG